MLVRRGKPGICGDRALENFECLGRGSSQGRMLVKSGVTQPVPDLRVIRIAAGGLLQS
jgi:hypothetical protein